MSRVLHPVSCKAVLLDQSQSKVLIVEYDTGNFGLPGGHIDADESPDEAMTRELREELSLGSINLQRQSFLKHPQGKIILGYVGIIDETTPITIDLSEVSAYHWVPITDVVDGVVKIDPYRELVHSVLKRRPEPFDLAL